MEILTLKVARLKQKGRKVKTMVKAEWGMVARQNLEAVEAERISSSKLRFPL